MLQCAACLAAFVYILKNEARPAAPSDNKGKSIFEPESHVLVLRNLPGKKQVPSTFRKSRKNAPTTF